MQSATTLYEAFMKIPDPRGKYGLRHPLPGVLSMTVAAMLCGATTRNAIVHWGRMMWENERDFMRRLGFNSYTTPVNTTVMAIFNSLDVEVFEKIIAEWIRGEIGEERRDEVISIDGKTLRGSARPSHAVPGVHLISAYLHHPGCVKGQMMVDGKTNEFKAAVEFLDRVILKDSVVVCDAIYCQKDFARAVVDKGADYLLVVKDNQAALKEEIETAFMPPSSPLGREAVA